MAPMFVLELLVAEVSFAFASALGVPDGLVEVWLDVEEVEVLDAVVVVFPTGGKHLAAWIVNGLPRRAYQPPVRSARD